MAESFVSEPQLLDRAAVAAKLACTPRYVSTLVAGERIAFIRFGRKLRFRPEAVEAFLVEHSTPIFIQPAKKPLSALDLRMGKF